MINMPDVETLMAGGLADWLDVKAAERAKAREKVFYTQLSGGIIAAVIAAVVMLMGWSFQFAGFGAVVVGGLFFAWANNIR